jgi:hypothetical protein
VAATLANLADARATRNGVPLLPPGAGAADCRIDLKLLQWRALRAAGSSAAARARLQVFDPLLRPDLWAGTVQDGVARGFAVALEEAIALAPAPPAVTTGPTVPDDPTRVQTFTGTQLRKKKDLLVDSGGARVRFSRKEGVLFVDRDAGVHSADCLRFEARTDRGTLDAFVADESERPRLFSARFLQPVRYTAGAGHSELVLEGRLGRTARGFPCRIVLSAAASDQRVRLRVRIDNRHCDHRLRARFLGVPPALLEHACTDVHEQVDNDAGGFVAFTLVRACGRLVVDGRAIETPAAQCQGPIEHEFLLGLQRQAAARAPANG